MKCVMTKKDDFDSDTSLICYLASQLKVGRLALILGSGVSKDFGLPLWPKLLQCLFESKGAPVPACSDEQKAQYFRSTYFKNDTPGLLSAVHECLYRGADYSFQALRKNDTLAAIGALVMASHRGNVSDVVTFNYDNLLEIYLRYHGFVVASVHQQEHWNQTSDITIYHPHGLLSADVSEERSNDIILDQTSYSEIVGKDGNVWRQTILSVLRRKTCLFIGLSGNDRNLDSMMHDCRKFHAAGTENTAFWGVTFQTSDDEVLRTLWQDRGVYYKVIRDYEIHLPELLFRICQAAVNT